MFSGDTRVSDKLKELARDCDVLVHEATFAKEDRKLAYDYYHSTTEQAAVTAKEARAKRFILTHISARYQGDASLELQKKRLTFSPIAWRHMIS